MDAFTTHTGIVATLNRSNVDTDQIIPKQFLKSILRTGYGPNAFFDWRYHRDGSLKTDFELNAARFDGRSILVTGNNFGCGSSREHAVWALLQDGYAVIIAPWKTINGARVPGFADIFRSNAVKNGLLTIELPEADVERITHMVTATPGMEATVDLPGQTVTLLAPESVSFSFEIDGGSKERLMGGLDDIAISLRYEEEITRFEQAHDLLMAPQS
jgi:3-isopropylmalate/(R)-2-methylmalate dehydratase small subunit